MHISHNMSSQEKATNCQDGSQYYVCSKNNFTGCCTWDPCNNVQGCTPESTLNSTLASGTATGVTISSPEYSLSSPTSSPTQALNQSNNDENDHMHMDHRLQIGLGVGIPFFIICIICVILLGARSWRSRKKKLKAANIATSSVCKLP
jgi:hypothetical protein